MSRRRERLGSAPWSKSRRSHKIPTPSPDYTHLPDDRRRRRADPGLWPPGRRGVATGLHRDAIWRTDRPQRRGHRPQGPPQPSTPVYHPGRRQARRGQPEVVSWPALNPHPERVIPILTTRLAGRRPGEPAITSPLGSRLGLENWKRSVKWRQAIIKIGRPTLRVHDLRHTYASLARRAGADLRLLQKTMGHASITVTAHIYADLYDDELDDVASALDALDDRQVHER